jgi:hypothetical protein
MPQLLGSLRGQVGGVELSLAVTEVGVLALVPETVLAPNPLRANARTNPRINKASMMDLLFELQTAQKLVIQPPAD